MAWHFFRNRCLADRTDGITIRPLAEDRLALVTNLAVRADSKSRLVNEFESSWPEAERGWTAGQSRLPLTG